MFDLLGHPIPEGRGKPGRPEHVPTPENASKIRTMLVAGMGKAQIAAQLGLSVYLLNRHYFTNGKINLRHAREMALAEAKAKNMLQLQAEADAGNVSAMKEMRKVIEREIMLAMDDEVAKPDKKAARPAPIGKKDVERQAALEAEQELDTLFRRDRVN